MLFPDAYLPLRIFEPRYLNLIRTCQQDGTGFGVIALESGDEVRNEDGGDPLRLYEIGTLATVIQVKEIESNVLSIWAKGSAKFKIETHWSEDSGLEVAQVTFLSLETHVPIDPDIDQTTMELYRRLERSTPEHPPDESEKLSQNIVANRLAQQMPFPLFLKQQMLESDDAEERLRLITYWLNAPLSRNHD